MLAQSGDRKRVTAPKSDRSSEASAAASLNRAERSETKAAGRSAKPSDAAGAQKPAAKQPAGDNEQRAPTTPHLSKGQLVYASYDFRARNKEEIGFARGDQLVVIGRLKGEKHWYFVGDIKSQHIGLAPLNYLSVDPVLPNAPISAGPSPSDSDDDSPFRSTSTMQREPSPPRQQPRTSILKKDSKMLINDTSFYHKSVELLSLHCFHGRLSRDQCEQLLRRNGHVGDYLVRESETYRSEYALTVFERKPDFIQHYRMTLSGPYFQLQPNDRFSLLDDLIAHYRDGRLLDKVPLANSVSKIGPCYFMVDSRAFKLNEWTMTDSMLETGRRIAQGEFGEVSEAQYNGMRLAVKTYSRESTDEREGAQNTRSQGDHSLGLAWFKSLSEAAILSQLSHSNIVKLIGVIIPPESLYKTQFVKLLLEFVDGISLLQYARSRTQADFDHHQFLDIVRKVADAMAYLEEKNLVHGDLAARNVLVNPQRGSTKLSDFGHAHPKTMLSLFTRRLPVRWSPPEALESGSPRMERCDIWAFGVLLTEVFSRGKHPYGEWTNDEVSQEVRGGFTLSAERSWPGVVQELLRKTFAFEPANRPTFSSVLKRLDRELISPPTADRDRRSYQQ